MIAPVECECGTMLYDVQEPTSCRRCRALAAVEMYLDARTRRAAVAEFYAIAAGGICGAVYCAGQTAPATCRQTKGHAGPHDDAPLRDL